MKELTGKERKSERIYFKVYKSQVPVTEQAIETATWTSGSDKFPGRSLKTSADFWWEEA